MAVEIVAGGKLLHPLTSPPKKPEPYPDEELIAKAIQYDDREILVTIPFPDTIELITDVLNEHTISPYAVGSSKTIYKELDSSILEYVQGFLEGGSVYSPAPKVWTGERAYARFMLPYDPAQPLHRARLSLERRKGDDFGIWSLRLEFSPSKAGPNGLVQLTAQIEEALPIIDIDRVLRDFRVSRVDAAIDLIGANPLDLIAHIPKPGKRAVYVGDDGAPETIYFYQLKPKLLTPPKQMSVKTVGPLRLTLYEKRNHQRQLALPTPYGACPVTRAEVSKRWTKGRPLLGELPSIKNLFDGRTVAYAPPVGGSSRGWNQFCMAALGAGADSALYALLPGGVAFHQKYQSCAGDLIDGSGWDRWADGLEYVGLDKWIAKANY